MKPAATIPLRLGGDELIATARQRRIRHSADDACLAWRDPREVPRGTPPLCRARAAAASPAAPRPLSARPLSLPGRENWPDRRERGDPASVLQRGGSNPS